MKYISRFLSIIIIFGALVAVCSPADAGAYLYSGKRKRIKCGVVWITDNYGKITTNQANAVASASNGGVGNLFYLLDNLLDMKPSGWTFENPLAPSITSSVTGAQVKPDKNDPYYWRISLRQVRDLSMMDVLYLPDYGTVKLDNDDREKLRQFVDGGGVLWIDNASGSNPLSFTVKSGSTDTYTFFIPNFEFKSTPSNNDVEIASNRHHPLLTTPYWLNDMEVGSLGSVTASNRTYCIPGYGRKDKTNFDVLLPVVEMPSISSTDCEPTVAANIYGSGRIVATSNCIGKGCFYSYPNNLPNLKFAYNVMSYSSGWTNLRKNPRHSGSSLDTVNGTELIEHWSLPKGAPTAGIESAPVVYKNVVFYSIGNTLYAADAYPSEDIDQDGNTDDGTQDMSTASHGEDVIWEWVGDGILSSPTIVTAQSPNDPNTTIEAVLVMSASGKISMIEAFPTATKNGVTSITDSPNVFKDYDVPATQRPFPPIYINGWVYAIGGDGRLYAFNPTLEKESKQDENNWEWEVPAQALTYSVEPRSGPCFGFMKNETSGAVVGMVYWCGSYDSSHSTIQTSDSIYGVPVFVSNDRVKRSNTVASQTVTVTVNYKYGHLTAPIPSDDTSAIRIINSDGSDFTHIQSVKLNAGGDTSSMITIQASEAIPTDALIYATYSLDYASVGVTNQVRLTVIPSITSTSSIAPPITKICGTPAMGAGNMIYLTGRRDVGSLGIGGTPATGGSVFAYKNDGLSSTKTLSWHYFMHGEIPSGNAYLKDTGQSDVYIPAVVTSEYYPDSTNKELVEPRPMVNPQPCASPAVAGDKVFVTVSGSEDDTGTPRAALLCFKANPEFKIRVTEVAGYDSAGNIIRKSKKLTRTDGSNMSIRLWQPNLIMPSDQTGLLPASAPLLSSSVTSVTNPPVSVDYNNGIITFNDFSSAPWLRSSYSVNCNTFSPSLPVWVYLDNVEVPVDFSTWGPSVKYSTAFGTTETKKINSTVVDLSGWNNLLWYYVVPAYEGDECTGAHNSPIVIGNMVYFITDDGIMYGLSTEQSENEGGKIADDSATWVQKVSSALSTSSSSDPTSSISVSAAGSNGILLVPGSDGLHAFTNDSTLVADNNRIVELDGGGKVSWSLDTIKWPAIYPTSTSVAPPMKTGEVNKPSKVRYIGNGEMLLVNSGANQVCKIDKSGAVGYENLGIRWIFDKFTDPQHLLRPGQPLQLRGPADAILWEESEPTASGSNNQTVYTIHCVIADSGNHRVVDLVYRMNNSKLVHYDLSDIASDSSDYDYDSSSGFILPELNWVTKTDSTNEKYTYDSLQIVPTTVSGLLRYDIWAAISNYSTGTDLTAIKDDSGSSTSISTGYGGAIVDLSYRSRKSGDWSSPWVYGTSSGDYADDHLGGIIARCDRVSISNDVKPLACPRFFEVYTDSNNVRKMIICDNYGVYQVNLSASIPTMENHLWNTDYSNLLRKFDETTDATPAAINVPLYATSVQHLPNGHWLISNGYSGPSNGIAGLPFRGEVFEFDPAATNGSDKIIWCAPRLKLTTTDGVAVWSQVISNSYLIQQPRSAFRQL